MSNGVKLSLLFFIFFFLSSQAVAADSYFNNSAEKFVDKKKNIKNSKDNLTPLLIRKTPFIQF